MIGGCACYLDDMSFVGKTSTPPVLQEEVKFSDPIDGKYLIDNGVLENGQEG